MNRYAVCARLSNKHAQMLIFWLLIAAPSEVPATVRTRKKENLCLFSNHDRSLLRQQPKVGSLYDTYRHDACYSTLHTCQQSSSNP